MRAPLLLCLLAFCGFLTAQTGGRNAAGQQDKPYVILISLDGYRWDYTQRFRPPHLSRLIAEGAQAESMISCFPSKTFPNHYSIATGLVPERHGLVDNSFHDPARGATYTIGNRAVVEDGAWYGGTPLWVLAEQQGMVAASYFFVGSEADVQGLRPTFWKRYDGSTPNRTRIEQALTWLRLPPGERPHLITLYFSDMDDAGHRYGPNDDEKLSPALLRLDEDLGALFDGVRRLDLPVHIIIVSDHGMAEVGADQLLPVEPLEDEANYRLVNNGALAHLYLTDPGRRDSILLALRAREANFRVFTPDEFPFYTAQRDNPRLGDLILLTDFPYYFSDARRIGSWRNMGGKVRGEHGFDPTIRDLHGIFYAWGPRIRDGLTVPSFRNIDVYPFICRLLGLQPPPGIDGNPATLAPLLR